MQPTRRTNREVSPHVRARAEVQLLQRARRRLEARIGVLGRDTHSDDVALRAWLPLQLACLRVHHVEVDLGRPVRRHAIKLADMPNTVQRDTHSDL